MEIYELIKEFGPPAGVALFTFLVSIFLVILDSILLALQGVSVLGLKKSKKSKILFSYFLWTVGAGLTAFILSLARILETSEKTTASIFVAVCWPLIYTKLIKNMRSSAKKSDLN